MTLSQPSCVAKEWMVFRLLEMAGFESESIKELTGCNAGFVSESIKELTGSDCWHCPSYRYL